MAEKEGLFGLCPHPYGAAFATLRHSWMLHIHIEPLYIFLGFECVLNRQKKNRARFFFRYGGEGGIRTLDGAINPILP